jgi:hypothetical protein
MDSMQPRGKGDPLDKLSIDPRVQVLSRVERAIVQMIRARVARGESLERIARTSRLPYSMIRGLARVANIRYKHRRPSKEQIRDCIAAVRDHGCTFRAAAQMYGMSKTAVHRYVAAKRRKSIDAAGEVQFEDGHREFSRNKRSWLCPVHGRVVVWPCVACGALAAKGRRDG